MAATAMQSNDSTAVAFTAFCLPRKLPDLIPDPTPAPEWPGLPAGTLPATPATMQCGGRAGNDPNAAGFRAVSAIVPPIPCAGAPA